MVSIKKTFKVFTILLLLSLLCIVGCDQGGENLVETSNTQQSINRSITPVSLFNSSASLNWTMINVGFGDAHLIQIKDGKTILIDTGLVSNAQSYLIPYIGVIPINKIDYVFITHPHSDHYEGLTALISSNISIGAVYFNVPTDDRCEAESWGCNAQDIADIIKLLEEKNVPLNKAEAGMSFDIGDDSSLDILYAFNVTNSPVGSIDLNDESLVTLVRHKNHRFLLTGDLNSKIGTYLAANGQDLQADVLKFPHHGTAGIAPNSFFDKINPQYVIITSPSDLWCSDRSTQARSWLKEKNIPAYITGFHGNVNIGVVNDKLTFATQYDYQTTNLCNETK